MSKICSQLVIAWCVVGLLFREVSCKVFLRQLFSWLYSQILNPRVLLSSQFSTITRKKSNQLRRYQQELYYDKKKSPKSQLDDVNIRGKLVEKQLTQGTLPC